MTIPADRLVRRTAEDPAPDAPFLSEWLAAGRASNQLAISGVCNCNCIFCSNHTNPFHIVEGLFRDLDDIKHQLSLMSVHDSPLRLSDSLPGRVSEGEAFLHPRLFEILKLVRRKYPLNTLCFTTNGSMLEEAFLAELAAYRPIEINLSLHSTQPALWSRIFQRSEKSARTAIASLDLYAKYRIDLEGTIVPLPAICGWTDIEQTFAALTRVGAKTVTLYWPGHSVSTPPDVVADLACPIDELAAFADRMHTKHGVPIQLLPDPRAALKGSVRRVMATTWRGNPKNGWGPFREVLWLASEAAHDRLRSKIQEHAALFPTVHRIEPVKNLTYGGNIIVSGLLMVDDFIEAGRAALERWPDTDLVLIPHEPFDALHRDLRKRPVHAIADSLGRRVWMIHGDGRADPLLDRVFLPLRGANPGELKKVLALLDEVWRAGDATDRGFDAVAAYPLETSLGPLDREQLRAALLRHKARARDKGTPRSQRFEVLDDAQALCIETWEARDPLVVFGRWTFFAKTEAAWRVVKIVWGEDRAYEPDA